MTYEKPLSRKTDLVTLSKIREIGKYAIDLIADNKDQIIQESNLKTYRAILNFMEIRFSQRAIIKNDGFTGGITQSIDVNTIINDDVELFGDVDRSVDFVRIPRGKISKPKSSLQTVSVGELMRVLNESKEFLIHSDSNDRDGNDYFTVNTANVIPNVFYNRCVNSIREALKQNHIPLGKFEDQELLLNKNEDQVLLLNVGIESGFYGKNLLKYKFANRDFSGSDFELAYADNSNLINMRGADLRCSDFTGARFRADFSGADLRGSFIKIVHPIIGFEVVLLTRLVFARYFPDSIIDDTTRFSYGDFQNRAILPAQFHIGSKLNMPYYNKCGRDFRDVQNSEISQLQIKPIIGSNLSGKETHRVDGVIFNGTDLRGFKFVPSQRYNDTPDKSSLGYSDILNCPADGFSCTDSFLQEVNITNTSLVESDFSKSKIQGLRLKNCNLHKSNFKNCDLVESNHQNGESCSINNCDVNSSDFSYSDLRLLTSTDSNFKNSDFSCSRLDNSTFVKCNLSNVEFNQTFLGEVTLNKAGEVDTSNICSFKDCDLKDADFRGALLGDETNTGNHSDMIYLTKSNFKLYYPEIDIEKNEILLSDD